MKKRQAKKFAKGLPDLTPYREAYGRGSKRLWRRWKAFKRIRRGVPADPRIEQMRAAASALRKQVAALRKALKAGRGEK